MKKSIIWLISLVFTCLIATQVIHCQNIGLVDVKSAEQIITVGGPDADVPGFTSEAIQIALDALKTRGGGIVKLNPGVYDIIGPVRLSDNTSLKGSGKKTLLRKCDGFETSFIIDADWGMLKAMVKDASGFKAGMGIQLYDDHHDQGWDVTTAVITDIGDNVIYFDNRTVNDYLASLNGTITNGCSIVEVVDAVNVKIADFIVEGNKAANSYINGCRGGGIYIHKSKDCLVENVRINEFNGDSFSWQITENITLRGQIIQRSKTVSAITIKETGSSCAGGCRMESSGKMLCMPMVITGSQLVIRIQITFSRITMFMKMAHMVFFFVMKMNRTAVTAILS